MKKIAMRLLSMLIVLSMVLSAAPLTALATENTASAAANESFDLSAIQNVNLLKTDGVEVDEDDPSIIAVSKELDNLKVLNADGTSSGLTEEQKQQVLYLFQQYLDQWEANANLLGVQTPFFLQYNDNGEDGLGILGEMLAMSNIPVDAVRAGAVSFDDLTGMITNFYYADQLGIEYYGDAIKSARNEVLDLVKESGAVTDAQKLLVINNWLAQNVTFDMEYIMNADKDTNGDGVIDENDDNPDPMVAENPQKHEHYDDVYNVMYALYEQQIRDQFEGQIRSGLEAEFKNQYYQGAIREVVYQIYLAQLTPEEPAPSDPTTPSEPEESEPTTPSEPVEGGTTEEVQTVNADASIEDQANALADQFMADNADAIAADPEGFCRTNEMMLIEMPVTDADGNYVIGEDGQPVMMPIGEQLIAGWDPFWQDAQENGVAGVNPENPEQKVKVDDIVAQQMNTPMDDLGGMTPNEAIPVYAKQAALGLTDGILNYWQGSHFGALGRGNAVCLGYTKAFTYLVQCLKSDIYTTNGKIDDASNWKTAKDLYYTNGELDINKNYAVDCVRISFDAQVTMYGETQDNFNSDHFWNAVKIDGQWYYVDPCYVDVYTEVMIRDRVETDGSVNHLYFLFSHGTAAELYDGNYSEIKTLYSSAANSTAYEDSWMSRIKSNVYFNGGVAYYIYNSTDIVTLMEDYDNGNSDVDMNDFLVKLVGHTLDTSEANDQGDTDYTTYIEFNYYEDEDDEEPEARVRDANGKMVTNDMLTALYADHEAASDIYPSLAITCALYNNKLYFNLNTSILCYDLKECTVSRVKEYNTVYGVRDDTNPFGGMAFSTTTSANNADFTVYNHPIAALALKDDGNLYVSIATNFAFISGKDHVNDTSSYGYEYEESNFNPEYSSYTAAEYGDNDMYEQMGYEKETNDNDEFMWSANFVEKISMSKLAGTSHDYEAVSVDATCRNNAYTENRCTDCGAIEAGSRVEEEGTAHAHHYIYFYETFYTKDSNGNQNADHCYVCTECGFAISEPTEPQDNDMYGDYGTSYEEQMEIYEAELAVYNNAKETAGHTYVPTNASWASNNATVTFSKLECSAVCSERKNTLDALLANDQNNNAVSVSLRSSVTANASVIDTIGTCPEGATQIWGASGTASQSGKDYPYTVTKAVALDPTACKFEGGFCTVCGDCTVHRIAGSGRYETSLTAVDALKAEMGVESFDTIIVASGENFADALTGSYLATVKKAPIMLHNDNYLDANVSYITANLTQGGTVDIRGGTSSVSAELENALKNQSITVKRLAGADRFATNLAILNEAGVTNQELLVCTGSNFADSLSASATGLPMLLVGKTLNEDQVAFLEKLNGNDITVIGGVNSVSTDIETALGEYSENVTRIAGASREDTSVAVAKKYFENPDFIVLAFSGNYPDGLCGGPIAFTMKAPLILTAEKTADVAAAYAAENEITSGLILGGVNSVSDATAKKVFNLTGEGEIPAL